MSQVNARFGKPSIKQTNDEGETILGYHLEEIMYGQESKLLMILFDQNQKVKKYLLTEA